MNRPRSIAAALVLLAVLVAPATAGAYETPPPNAGFDYQIGGDYPLPDGVSVVSRDWFSGRPAAAGNYSICYVNGFQTQANEPGTDRPDELSNWPRKLVLKRLGDDPHWGGEYLVDIGSRGKRKRAARWVGRMIRGCADAGYDAVEFDNLDSWTRFRGTPLAGRVPFGKRQALDYAGLLADRAHSLDLAVGQKNTAELSKAEAGEAGFDFAIAEECGRWRECNRYRRVYGDEVVAIEYRRSDFRRACSTAGDEIAIVLRDKQVSTPSKRRYVFDAC